MPALADAMSQVPERDNVTVTRELELPRGMDGFTCSAVSAHFIIIQQQQQQQ